MKNVCQWTTLFETLSPPETCFSSKLSETSTNYTFEQFELVDLTFHLPIRIDQR
jgi:hypothetical protein